MLGVAHLSVGHHQEAVKFLAEVAKNNHRYKQPLLLLLAIGYKKVGNLQQSLKTISGNIEEEQTI